MPSLPWIERTPGAPYFRTSEGEPWTPIGQNDAVSWPELNGLFRRRDLTGVEQHLRYLRGHGVTCLRLMLEYAQGQHRYLERPAGQFNPAMVRLWDDLLDLCERNGLRVLLTPFDTFFTWIRWRHHPYNRRNGGPCAGRNQLLTCLATREAIKARLDFATRRWGSRGVIFGWDLWNEMHPAHGGNDPTTFGAFIDDVGPFLRALEIELHGRAHPQCVSVFGPELLNHPQIVDPIFRHPHLDFASSHFYEHGTIDDPRDTVAPAVSVGRLTREALRHIADQRPFFDSEHGPIHRFKDRHHTLPEPFDDEYFRHIQWAHLASGGAGGGMRWPNRSPHVLTAGMRRAQRALAGFLPLIQWDRFHRRNLNEEVEVDGTTWATFACGDAEQAVVWLLRRTVRSADGRVEEGPGAPLTLGVPGLAPGERRVVLWNTREGQVQGELRATVAPDGILRLTLPVSGADVALAIGLPEHG
ncbi:glycoside hydrolase 5 family protein [Roseomonas elaeocarpi]|uniref:Glycoside hydrolase family 5 domain-containing protein n=1 Tax=Roseomonas elaeocarpi TaxID=907779 RepID=A0ABV6JYK8_9PROT